eukprot:CAMPEP_0201562502 /NCGR_PEP_ID=MMETSP0173_2-20130828/79364_1 /ASSEMBLY_ACC=CAM_ASM_000268 /TAXON_ID=218659 /ORGANISM="Vexillifera sp., Strain DIVA3 564/2" /LENGTH=872 /DNA_ID=CAMNT_0047977075 /DNA_START=231 /DNA_END=2845 /DNA_ORIENTATION=-
MGAAVEQEKESTGGRGLISRRSLPAVDMHALVGKAIHCGVLYKKGKKLEGAWRKRFCVIGDDFLFYYFTSQNSKRPKGIANLRSYDTVQMVDDSGQSADKYMFQLTGTTTQAGKEVRTFLFYASTSGEQQEWMQAINEAFRRLQHAILQSRNASFNGESTECRERATLKVTVNSAKDLQSRGYLLSNGPLARCNPYVLMKVANLHTDVNEVRTTTKWDTNEPLWGETFYINFDDVAKARNAILEVLCFVQLLGGRDKVLGLTKIPINSLTEHHEIQQWWPISEITDDDVVTGTLHLKIFFQPPPANGAGDGFLNVHVLSASNLARRDINGLSDPYVKLKFADQRKKTKTIKKNLNPIFNEQFSFAVSNSVMEKKSKHKLEISVWDWDRFGKNDFLGQLLIPLSDIRENFPIEDLFVLCPLSDPPSTPRSGESSFNFFNFFINFFINLLSDPPSTPRSGESSSTSSTSSSSTSSSSTSSSSSSSGSIRLSLRWTVHKILPSSCYLPLSQFLLEDKQFKLVRYLGISSLQKEELAKLLVRIAYVKKSVLPLVVAVCSYEIDSTPDPEIIFRGNSIATKIVDFVQKVVGLNYLNQTVARIVHPLLLLREAIELDVNRLEDPSDTAKAEENTKKLLKVCSEAVFVLFSAAHELPIPLRKLYQFLQHKVSERYKDIADEEKIERVRLVVVSSFLFLRLICPAILGPKLFDLTDSHPTQPAARTLTLVAKTIQNLANFVEFGAKEPYMEPINAFIKDNLGAMKSFINNVSTPPEKEQPRLQRQSSVQVAKMLGFGEGSKPTAQVASSSAAPKSTIPGASTILYDKEMSKLHFHILSYKEKIKENAKDDPKFLAKLDEVLKELQTSFELYFDDPTIVDE